MELVVYSGLVLLHLWVPELGFVVVRHTLATEWVGRLPPVSTA